MLRLLMLLGLAATLAMTAMAPVRIMNHQTAAWGDGGFGWIGYRYSNVGHYVAWVRAASTYYPVAKAAVDLLPRALPFPPAALGPPTGR